MKIGRERRVGQEVNREEGMREEDSEDEDGNRWRHKRRKIQKDLGAGKVDERRKNKEIG